MIVKHVPMQSAHKSNFAELVNYMLDEQKKYERVGYVQASNCRTQNIDVAVLAIQNTQNQNTRAVSDKTYHLIVSFPCGERPEDKVLQAIEARICEGLGLKEHQRVSAVHHDTDNLHFHIAINKIHPMRYTMHDPGNPDACRAPCRPSKKWKPSSAKPNRKARKVCATGPCWKHYTPPA